MKNIGVDIVKNDRFKDMVNKSRKYSRILSPKEVEIFTTFTSEVRRIEYLASRFAAKEAMIKALNKTDASFNYVDVSILNDNDGAPYIEFGVKLNYDFLISISHSEDNSIAFVVLI